MTTQCYGVDGTPHKPGRYIPCNATAVENGGHTNCCAPGDNCLSNGLCQGQSDNKRKANLFWRNGCTDPTWNNAACAKYCVGLGEPDTHATFYCLIGQSWCCPNGFTDLGQTINTTCCTVSSLQFQAADPTIYTIAEFNVATATTAKQSQTAVSSAALQSSTDAALSTASSAEASQASSASSPSSTSSSSGSSSKIGVYVGVPLGIVLALLIGVIAFLVLKKRKARSKPAELDPQGYGYGHGHGHGQEKRPHLAEADYVQRPMELPHNQPAAELPDSRLK